MARLAPGGVFIDVGAHIGVYSLIAAQVVGPTGRVFAIEPQSACLTPLHTNASANGLTNIVLIPAAASDHDGATQFTANPRSMGGMVAEHGELAVRSLRLETFAREHNLRAIDLVKLDAAGNEYAILQGAGELLREHRIGALLCKLYRPSVVAERFGYDGHARDPGPAGSRLCRVGAAGRYARGGRASRHLRDRRSLRRKHLLADSAGSSGRPLEGRARETRCVPKPMGPMPANPHDTRVTNIEA